MFRNGAISKFELSQPEDELNEFTGAEISFAGRVRADILGQKTVSAIEFTAHEVMAKETAATIIEESRHKFGILGGTIFHSLGIVAAGEICFLVKVQGQHRNESFDATRYIVDEVKKRCPIFGREIFDDGTQQWKINT